MANNRRSRRRGANKKDVRLPLLIALAFLLALFVIVMPKTPVVKAVSVSASGNLSTHAGLVISEVMTDNVSAYPDETGKFGDWVEIINTLDTPINLRGVGLSDRSDRIIFLFPDVNLIAGGTVTVFCDDTNRDNPNNVFHAKFKLSSLGETVYLFDENGVAIDTVKVPTLNNDECYARGEAGEWEKTYDYSPGYPNTVEGHDAYLAAFVVEPGALRLNEVVPSPKSGLRDADGDFSDWVELYNAGTKDIKLGNYALSDDETKPAKWPFPKDAVIPAGGYYIVFCSGKDKVEESTNYPHTNFSINNEQETIVLSTLVGELVDQVVVNGVERDMSYGRDEDGNWRVFTLATPGAPNNQTGANRADQFIRALNPTGVYISEVMSSANLIKPFEDKTPCDYVELYNSSTVTWDLSGWGLSDNINWPRKWTFPQGTSISPGEYKVIMLDGYTGGGQDPARLRASFKLAHAGGEMMTLSDASGAILDRMYLPEIPTDISYGRTLGAGGFFYYDAPTPGAANSSGFTGFSARPVFDHESGLYYGTLEVALTAEPGATIRYTTDGSIPTVDNSSVYTGPIPITDTMVIRARAFQPGLQPSETETASFFMELYHTLDVVSLVCDPEELWNPTTGLLSEEPDHSSRNRKNPEADSVRKQDDKGNLILPFQTPVYRNYGKDDRQGYVEIFDHTTGEAYISQGIKMDLMGAYSLDMPQKSFKIRAQAALGEKYFNVNLFEGQRDYEYYKSFTLRNSGNDCVWTRVADGVETLLVDNYLDSDLMTLAWRPVIVYLNGEYWGHYNLRERKDRFSIAQHEGLDLEKDKDIYENMTIIKGNSTVVQGSSKEYLAMRDHFKTLSPNTSAADLQYIYDNIDVDSYIDWFAIKMFFGDSDPGNIMFYKLPTEGAKWKCLLFDTDYGLYMSGFNSPWSYMKEAGMGQQKINNVIFRKMLEADEIREKFFVRIGQIFQTLTTEVMIAQLDECVAQIEIEMKMHFQRWAGYPDTRIINSDSPSSAEGLLRYWRQRVDRFKNVMTLRPYKFWGLFQDEFKLSDQQMEQYFGPRPADPEAK
ncbi:MAG: lamin tail domain-containing protein [Clostridia bacterium]|nr:lamin tail domain-containing protein [Clostridia bacterium]